MNIPNQTNVGNNPTNFVSPNTPIVFKYFVEMVYYPSTGQLYPGKMIPIGRKFKQKKQPNINRQQQLNDVDEEEQY